MMSFSPSQDQIDELDKRGIVIIEDYLSEEQCDELKSKIDHLIEEDTIAWETGGIGYDELASRGEVVVNERAGENDDGMLDIFNVDQEISEVDEIKSDPGISDLINGAATEHFTPDNINVYYNREVTDTRGFHADTYSGKYKAFVYLTDVPDKSYGPFSYIPGTHKVSGVKKNSSKVLNKIKGDPETDAVFYDEDEAIYCTAPKGTLIVANQAGYHRGTPQQKGHTRMLVNTSYTPSN